MILTFYAYWIIISDLTDLIEHILKNEYGYGIEHIECFQELDEKELKLLEVAQEIRELAKGVKKYES